MAGFLASCKKEGSMFSKSDPRLVLIQEYAPHMLGTYQDIKNYQTSKTTKKPCLTNTKNKTIPQKWRPSMMWKPNV